MNYELINKYFQHTASVEGVFWNLSILFTLSGVFFLLFVMASRKSKTYMQTQLERLNMKCQPVVTELAFDEHLSPKSQALEKELLSSREGRTMLLAEIIKIRGFFQGEAASVIEKYYISKKLYKLSFKKLKANAKHLKIAALNELVGMSYQESARTVIQHLKREKDEEIIENTLLALTKLSYELGLKEILNHSIYLTDWLQLQIIQVLEDKKVAELPALNQWLTKDASRIIFGTRLIAYTKSERFTEEMMELLRHPEELVRNEIIKTFALMEFEKCTNSLLLIFDNETVRNQCQIIKALIVFNQRYNLPFLSRCSENSREEVKRLALEAVMKLRKDDMMPGIHTPFLSMIRTSEDYLAKAV